MTTPTAIQLESRDAPDRYLSSLTEVEVVARRRPRLGGQNEEHFSKPHDNTYGYSVRVQRDEVAKTTLPQGILPFLRHFS
ncbi:hypothetical protein RRG08_051559 [Elysia crispata]|uniref:Uncharacterized protein n=1 Tax=Elysia crispata TaxID=231223 RepID=A0AAE1CQJ2_9GAST|nr:hypothetical protein RRG08_051559 [Elysia crispata]